MSTTALVLALALGLPGLVRAQGHQHAAVGETQRDRYSIPAVKVDQSPRIDGVLDDQVWQRAPLIEQFVQQEPREGAAATERTEVRVMYDGKSVLIAVHAFDAQPAGIVATEMRRDSDRLLDEDNFQLILDTFNDSRNGYMFVTTPLGAKLEQQISEEGEGNTRAGLINANVNKNWDGIWDVAARITDDGWTAEIAIPLTTLRFADTGQQSWGINFMRNIRRKNEQVFWAPIPKAYSLTRVSMAGSLVGLQALDHGLDLKLKPYVVSGVRANRLTAGSERTAFLRDIGADAKYGVTGGMNLDVTYNTDFAQVEVDEQQVNLTRFSLLFPEKRDFFLENAGQFKMGTGGTFTSSTVETDLFFSRRIGLSDSGAPIPIVGGGRLAGKQGRHNVGLLDIQTDRAFDKPGENFLVARYSSDVFQRSRVGAIFVNKEAMGGDPHYNRTVGADANLVLGKGLQLNSFVAKTDTPGLKGGDMAVFGRIAYRDPAWNLWLNYLDVGENFNAEVGFVQRRGVKTTKAYFSPTPRPGVAGIRMLEPMIVITYITDQHNRVVGRTQHFMNGFYMQDGSFFNVIYQRDLDVLDTPFKIAGVTIPVGSYKFDEATFTYNTNPAKRVYERFTWNPMQFYDGSKQAVSAAVGVRGGSHLSSELSFSRNDAKLPFGNFVSNLGILRVDYAMSPRATIRSLTQYNSLTNEVTNSVRFNFIYRPGSDIYIVYNDLAQTGLPADAFKPSDRQIVVKINYLLAR